MGKYLHGNSEVNHEKIEKGKDKIQGPGQGTDSHW